LTTKNAHSFAPGRIKGAVNLNFSDISAGKLSEVIGSKQGRILIC